VFHLNVGHIPINHEFNTILHLCVSNIILDFCVHSKFC
jgi:hypothetical protein